MTTNTLNMFIVKMKLNQNNKHISRWKYLNITKQCLLYKLNLEILSLNDGLRLNGKLLIFAAWKTRGMNERNWFTNSLCILFQINTNIFPHLSFPSGVLAPLLFATVALALLFRSFTICRRSSLRSFSSSLTRDFRLSISSLCSRIILSCLHMHAFKVSTSESTLVRASKVDCIELILKALRKM